LRRTCSATTLASDSAKSSPPRARLFIPESNDSPMRSMDGSGVLKTGATSNSSGSAPVSWATRRMKLSASSIHVCSDAARDTLLPFDGLGRLGALGWGR
jgi:hypothetical protein